MRPLKRLVAVAFLGVASAAHASVEWSVVAWAGNPAPGFPGDPWIPVFEPLDRIGDHGEIFFMVPPFQPNSGAVVPAQFYVWTDRPAAVFPGTAADSPPPALFPVEYDVNRSGEWVLVDSPLATFCYELWPVSDDRVLRMRPLESARTVIQSGDQVPGTTPALQFLGRLSWSRSRPVGQRPVAAPAASIAASGAIAFGGGVGTSVCDELPRDALLTASPEGVVEAIAIEDELVPGMPDDMTYDAFALSPRAIDPTGRIAFFARVVSKGWTESAVLLWTPSEGVEVVHLIERPFPEEPTVYVPPVLAWPVIGPSGSIAFASETDGLFGPDADGGLAQFFDVGDPYPWAPEESFWGWPGSPSVYEWPHYRPPLVWINALDEVAFVAEQQQLSPSGRTEAVESGVFRAQPGGEMIERLVRSGTVAPDTGGSVFHGSFEIVAFGDRGEIAFRAGILRPAGGGSTTFEEAWFLIDAEDRLFPILTREMLASLAPGTIPYRRLPLAFDEGFTRVVAAVIPDAAGAVGALLVARVPEAGVREAVLTAAFSLATVAASRASRRSARRQAALTAARSRPPA